MHRFFQISELVELLCSHLEVERPTEWETTKNPELAALARTSSVFFSHTIPLIWSSVTLENLLRGCLPADSFDYAVIPMREFLLKVLRPLRDEDFERILSTHHTSNSFPLPLAVSIFPPVFRLAVDGSSWFSRNKLPNLRGICWEHFHNEFPYIEDFLFPELTMINIPYLSLGDLDYPYSLANRCPQLRDVTFPTDNLPHEFEGAVEQMNSAVSACLRGLHFLETLVVHELDHEAFRHVSRIPSLRSLRVDKIPSSILTHHQPLFPSLQTLHLSSQTDQPTRLLERCIDIPLAKFFIFHIRPTPDEAHRLFVAAASGICHTSMRSFSFYCRLEPDPNHQPNHATQSIRASSIRQLFCFANMTSVIIHLVTGVDLDDDTVEAMARSWRRVERLELQAQFGNPAPRASVGCLRAFVKYCPNLVGLYMTFDARVIPPSLDESPIIQKSLESLIVATSPIEVESAQSIAEFMAGVFPSLKDEWERAYPNFRGWREVKSLLLRM
ncbi:hypothetical protein FB45DRAFT_1150117 [Roridomyces roridus]|uniref:Uncharacterized protein n=1 Tax=Roridomyces roridus TaxID=1738132 RepID=A0AAD7BSZ3_9AGAR|nr:hypothetical protein FB45DRAFT_1150117 [Roridomyces roridus]